MKKQLLLSVVAASLLSLPVLAQTTSFYSAGHFGASGSSEIINEGETDSLGNMLLTGTFQGFTDFDPGPGTAIHAPVGGSDAYMVKYNSSGALDWITYFGGSGNETGRTITQDRWGNVYASGNFSGLIYFNPFTGTPTASSPTLATYIAKLSPAGNLIWVRAFTSTGGMYSVDITTDAYGNAYLTGQFGGAADLDPGSGTFNVTANGTKDAFICKYDSAGNFITAKQFGPSTVTSGVYTTPSQIRFDHAGNMLISGSFDHTVDLDPNAGVYNQTSAGNDDIFLVQLDNNLNFNWAKTFGGSGYDDPQGAMSIDPADNVILGGYYELTADFDPGPGVQNYTSNGQDDSWFSKFDSSGNLIWVKTFGGAALDYILDMDTDQNGDIYYTGKFSGAVDMDPNSGVNLQQSIIGSPDCYINKISAAGNLIWTKTFGDALSNEFSAHVGVDLNYNVYSAGRFASQMDFDPDAGIYYMTAIGFNDIYMHKMTQCFATQASMTVNSCGAFTAPSGQVLNSSGTYLDTISNARGCDSIITITLTVNPISVSSLNATVCSSYTSPAGNTYTSSGTYQDTISNSFGCDSIITINLIVNQPSASAITVSACNSYTSPAGNLYTTSGTYLDTIPTVTGCDSVITINLTVVVPDLTVVNASNVLTAVQNGASYQWLDCNNAYSPIAGATGQSYTATVNGDYAVAITVGSCTDTSACSTVIGLGVSALQNENWFSLNPNPTTGEFVLKLTTPLNDASVRITDVAGRTVVQLPLNADFVTLRLDEPAGLYFVEVLTGGEPVQRIKLIKTN